jgi:hypothetical protein
MTPSGKFVQAQPLVGRLTGATLGQFVQVPRGLLAVVGTERGLWVAQSGRRGMFGRLGRLAAAAQAPLSLASASLAGGRTAVAWDIAEPPYYIATAPAAIYYAIGSATAAPRRRQVAVTLPTGYVAGSVALTGAGGGAATVAWVAGWYDAVGTYHSRVFVADIGASRGAPTGTAGPAVAVSPPGSLASSVSLASDARGDEVLAWRGCTTRGVCGAFGALRRAHRAWRGPRTLGSLDASASPVVAETQPGTALVGWIADGHVYAASASASRPAPAGGFAPSHRVSATDYAADLTLAVAPGGGEALAVWTQGQLYESLMGARFSS